mmetsp:Transcript_4230/g.7809  ORF Transcript_4230/g.7809 Transcript_4230/m.7809 type:complete len:230 (-) Transcript_4230:890-1579(-)
MVISRDTIFMYIQVSMRLHRSQRPQSTQCRCKGSGARTEPCLNNTFLNGIRMYDKMTIAKMRIAKTSPVQVHRKRERKIPRVILSLLLLMIVVCQMPTQKKRITKSQVQARPKRGRKTPRAIPSLLRLMIVAFQGLLMAMVTVNRALPRLEKTMTRPAMTIPPRQTIVVLRRKKIVMLKMRKMRRRTIQSIVPRLMLVKFHLVEILGRHRLTEEAFSISIKSRRLSRSM